MQINVLYEDQHILALDKPTGLVVHSDGKTEEPALAEWVVSHYPETQEVGEPIVLDDGHVLERPGIVHRLDRETSGVILVAKTQEGFKHLKEQFKSRTVKKVYSAFVYGKFKDQEGVIDRPIGRSKKDFRKFSAQRFARGKLRKAQTEYNVLSQGSDVASLEVRPLTGRTHQIRVHMKAINHPVVCDKLYAPKHDCVLGFSRLALHARTITFTDISGKEQSIESPLPRDFIYAREMLTAM